MAKRMFGYPLFWLILALFTLPLAAFLMDSVPGFPHLATFRSVVSLSHAILSAFALVLLFIDGGRRDAAAWTARLLLLPALFLGMIFALSTGALAAGGAVQANSVLFELFEFSALTIFVTVLALRGRFSKILK
jgi:hypothetical protein